MTSRVGTNEEADLGHALDVLADAAGADPVDAVDCLHDAEGEVASRMVGSTTGSVPRASALEAAALAAEVAAEDVGISCSDVADDPAACASNGPWSDAAGAAVPGAVLRPSLAEEERWREVLSLLSGFVPAPIAMPAAGARINGLFSPFALPSVGVAVVRPTVLDMNSPEAALCLQIRERVLEATLARLYGKPMSPAVSAPPPPPPPPPSRPPPPPASSLSLGTLLLSGQDAAGGSLSSTAPAGELDVPDWKRKAFRSRPATFADQPGPTAASADRLPGGLGSTPPRAPSAPAEAPLDEFIRVFRLDELATTCLKKLEDDEAAYIIDSCQHRLMRAYNPSAVVMLAIRHVARKVGRRYYLGRDQPSSAVAGDGLAPTPLQPQLAGHVQHPPKEFWCRSEELERDTTAPFRREGRAEWD